MNLPCVSDILQWICVKYDEIRNAVFYNPPETIQSIEEFSRISGRGLEGFHRREPRFDHQGKFIVQARSRQRKTVDGVGSRKQGHARTVHRADQLTRFFKQQSTK